MSFDSFVYVAGHAGFKTEITPSQIPDLPFTRNDIWEVPAYRKNDIPLYGEHLQEGLRLASSSPNTLLITSGGFNERGYFGGAYNWSEAESYAYAGQKMGWYKIVDTQSVRVSTPSGSQIAIPVKEIETQAGNRLFLASNEYARDSLEEVLGGIVIFELLAKKQPKKATYVGWQFKAERFRSHARVLNISDKVFEYVGVNNPGADDVEIAIEAEAKTVAAFEKEPLGNSEELLQKRQTRDPLRRGNSHWEYLPLDGKF